MPVALTQPKKPVGGAYGFFLAEKRPEYQKSCAGQPASAVSKMAGEAWGKLSEAAKAPYNKKYEDAKTQFDKDMKAFLAGGGEVTKGARALRSEKRKAKDGTLKKKKDPNAPKKPVGGAYGVFLEENRAKIKKSMPADHKMVDVAKVAGEQWRALSEAQKKPYNDKYLKKQEEYQVALAEYKKNLPEEEDEEEDDNEEEEEEEEEEEQEPAPKKARK